jgi:hypothetical protein
MDAKLWVRVRVRVSVRVSVRVIVRRMDSKLLFGVSNLTAAHAWCR